MAIVFGFIYKFQLTFVKSSQPDLKTSFSRNTDSYPSLQERENNLMELLPKRKLALWLFFSHFIFLKDTVSPYAPLIGNSYEHSA